METYCDLYTYGHCEPSINVSELFSFGEIRSQPLCSGFTINIPEEAKNDTNKRRQFFQGKFLR